MSDINDVRNDINSLKHNMQELQRKSNGITLANARTAKLERDIARMDEQLNQLESRKQILGEHMTPAQAEAISGELTRLDGQAKAFHADIQAQLDALKDTVNDHGTRLDEHDDRFDAIDGDDGLMARLRGRVDLVGDATESAHERIDEHDTRFTRIEQTISGTTGSIIPLIFGIVVGVVTFIVVNDNSTRSIEWEIGVAVAAAAIAAGIAMFFVNQAKIKSQSTTQTTSTLETARTTSNTRSSAPANDHDRTETISVPEQDQASARS
jgi:hypothetical protein